MTRWRALLRATAASPIGAPTTLALIDMIRRPAERAGRPLPDELVDAMLADAGGQLGALPLVAFALSELWPEGVKEPDLTVAAYDHIGRLGGAIGRRAAALDLDDAQLNRLFPALVQISADKIATRRPLDRSTLPDAEIRELIDTLVEERFLVVSGDPSQPMVQLAHEILFTSWPALASWRRERGPHSQTRRELDDPLARWLESTSDQELIPPGSRLREAEDLLRAAPDLVADPVLRTFVESSLDRAARIDREAQDTLRREARRLTQLAEEQRKAGDGVTAMLLGLEALDRVQLVRDGAPLSPAATALYEAAMAPDGSRVLRGHDAPVLSTVFSPDSTRVLTASCGQHRPAVERCLRRGAGGPPGA